MFKGSFCSLSCLSWRHQRWGWAPRRSGGGSARSQASPVLPDSARHLLTCPRPPPRGSRRCREREASGVHAVNPGGMPATPTEVLAIWECKRSDWLMNQPKKRVICSILSIFTLTGGCRSTSRLVSRPCSYALFPKITHGRIQPRDLATQG